MNEIYGDAFKLLGTSEFNHLCITTNGSVKKNGLAVMGRGIALEVQKYFPDMPVRLGKAIREHGNVVQKLLQTKKGNSLWSFPVKHNWWEIADIELIKQSCYQLMEKLPESGHSDIRCLLPRPGCGNGKLSWEHVKPKIEPLLDDRVYIVTWK